MQQVQSLGLVPAEPPAWELDGRCHERLPEAVRRQQRFGGAAAAALAEAVAQRREIDRAAVQLGRRIAGAQPRSGGDGGNGSMVLGPTADPTVELEDGDNWISLRDAGLAVLASIADLRGGTRRDHG